MTAMLCSYKYQGGEKGDGDYHLYLSDSNCILLAEIMPSTPAMDSFNSIRIYEWHAAESAGDNWNPRKVTVTGLRYFDHDHFDFPVNCYTPNSGAYHIEIHPVLSITESQ